MAKSPNDIHMGAKTRILCRNEKTTEYTTVTNKECVTASMAPVEGAGRRIKTRSVHVPEMRKKTVTDEGGRSVCGGTPYA